MPPTKKKAPPVVSKWRRIAEVAGVLTSVLGAAKLFVELMQLLVSNEGPVLYGTGHFRF
ncbi:hypothetical protein [Spirosoma harenae]